MRVRLPPEQQDAPKLKRVRLPPEQPPAAAPAPASKKLRIVNAYWQNDSVVLINEDRTITRKRAPFSLFVKTAEFREETHRKAKGSKAVRSITRCDATWTRIECGDADYRKRCVAWLQDDQKTQTYEGDINPVRRWVLDSEPIIVAPRGCYIDIETDSRVPFSEKERARILCIQLADGSDWRTTPMKAFLLNEDTDEDEARLLREFWEHLLRYDQVIAWNGDGFDFPVIWARTKALGIKVPYRRWLWLDMMELFRRMNIMSAESGAEKQSVALQSVAMQILKEGKTDFDAAFTWEAWEAGGERRLKLFDYCGNDVLLMPKIEEKKGFIALLSTVCEVTGTFADTHGISPQNQVESYMLALGKQHNYKPKTKLYSDYDAPREQFEGAYVMKPRCSGIVKDVHVCDFAAMYPSIILTWNISPETKLPPVPNPNNARPAYLPQIEWLPEKHIPAGAALAPGTNVLFSQGTLGILSIAIDELIRMRKYWRDLKGKCAPGTAESHEAESRSNAYKQIGNSFYGVMGAPTSRYFDREVAESVTLAGKFLILATQDFAEARGWKVIYIDTDSLYVVGPSKEEFEAFVEECNGALYPRLVAERGCTRNRVKLEYEKQFERIVFNSAKKYAGRFLHYKGSLATEDSKPEVKGLEFNRGDVPRLTRDLQEEVIDLLITKRCEDPEQFRAIVEKHRDLILCGELAVADVMVSKRLTQALRAYKVREKKDGTAAAQPPHVTVAKELQKRGRNVREGTKIDYVCVDGWSSPKKYIPAEDFKGEWDRHETWESGVFPATQRLLEAAFPKFGWDAYARTRPAKAPARRAAKQAEATLDLFAHLKA
jgi:DNA polymerase, archaea type